MQRHVMDCKLPQRPTTTTMASALLYLDGSRTAAPALIILGAGSIRSQKGRRAIITHPAWASAVHPSVVDRSVGRQRARLHSALPPDGSESPVIER